MATVEQRIPKIDPTAVGRDVPFGVNEMRLNARQWLAAAAIFLVCLIGFPPIWKHIERFDARPDYRVPYPLSSDYWLYQRRIERISNPASIPVLGDSVVWGEYVRPDGTITHFLNQEAGQTDRFVNCGVNGVFPLAMNGLIANYGSALRNRKVIVHCNVLWMSSPKADLSTPNEETFNHTQLVPQFSPRIPCYKADAATRLSAVAWRNIDFFAWVNHINNVYFDQKSIPNWALAEDNSNPPRCPNAWRNPLSLITLSVPGEPKDDPIRGPASPRHKPWNAGGSAPTSFDWVGLDSSLQWQAFQRIIRMLRDRGNDVLVILGPFNENMVAEDRLPQYRELRDGITAWLISTRIPYVFPEVLPSDLYADASHPLTDGYKMLAERIWRDREFQRWVGGGEIPQ
jgi:hypothetical protein